ncbi:MAG: hypothetical protein ACI9TH_002051 [Kiritimatiellia bacterium]
MSFTLDFIGVGAAKAGTTWLGQCLKEHPGVCMSEPKELNYFGRKHVWPPSPMQYDQGPEWLRAHFEPPKEGQVVGEYSVAYLIDPASPQLIYDHNPRVKLFIALRNPIDALFSFYYELIKQYIVPDTFESLLEQYPDFIRYGFYDEHIARFQALFPPEQIHFMFFDDLHADPAKFLREAYAYIGVDPDFEPPSLHARVNERREPRYRWMRDAIGGTRDYFRTRPALKPVQETLRALGVERLGNWVQARNQKQTPKPVMDPATRERLALVYAPHNAALAAMLRRELDWA